jgi:hypothetical protein
MTWVREFVEEAISNPTKEMRVSFKALTSEDREMLQAASSHFHSEANSLQAHIPPEPDSDEYYSGSHASGELDINELFSDL